LVVDGVEILPPEPGYEDVINAHKSVHKLD